MKNNRLFQDLQKINEQPRPFELYTADDLWTDEHTSARMLEFHLDQTGDVSSRNARFIDRSVDWIVSRFDIAKGTKVADFGCGPGLYTTRLARRGAEVTGIDFSARSIDFARQAAGREKLEIQYVQQNYLDFVTETRFDLVLMIMCDFCALSPDQRSRLLTTFHTILRPGGSVLLDVYSMEEFDRVLETRKYGVNTFEGFWSPRPYFCFQNTFKYPADRVVLEKYTIVEADRIRTVYNWFQYFTPEELKRELLEAGLPVEELYLDVAGAPYGPGSGEFAVVARKQAELGSSPSA